MTNDYQSRELEAIEQELLTPPGHCSGVGWLGFGIYRERGSKRTGHNIRWGKSGFVKLVYRDWFTQKELTRTEVIAELAKPAALREAFRQLTEGVICNICGAVGFGYAWDEDRRHWQRLCYFKPSGLERGGYDNTFAPTYERISLDICPQCVKDIAETGKVR